MPSTRARAGLYRDWRADFLKRGACGARASCDKRERNRNSDAPQSFLERTFIIKPLVPAARQRGRKRNALKITPLSVHARAIPLGRFSKRDKFFHHDSTLARFSPHKRGAQSSRARDVRREISGAHRAKQRDEKTRKAGRDPVHESVERGAPRKREPLVRGACDALGEKCLKMTDRAVPAIRTRGLCVFCLWL